MSSMKNSSEKLKNTANEIKDTVKKTVDDLADSIPRPLTQRKTMFLKKPILQVLKERREDR